MKILQLVQKPQRRGAEVFAFQLAQELRRNHQEVRIAYLYPYAGLNGIPLHSGDVLLSGSEDHPFEKVPGFHPGLLRRLREFIKDFQPDILQANGARTVKYAAFAHRRCGDSWVMIYRNIGNPHDWIKGWLRPIFYKRWVMPEVQGIVGVSETTLKRVIDFYGLSIPAIHIPRGIDVSSMVSTGNREEIRKACSTPYDAPVLLYIGSLTQEKRPDRFLRIVSRVKKTFPALHAWVIGDGPLKPELLRAVVSLDLENVVQFLGIQPDVASYLRASDLLLLPSDSEGIPGVILEAGAAGIPAIATSVGGVPECVLDGETGILVDPGNEDEFAEMVMRLLNDPVKRKKMGEKARNWITQNFEIGKIAAKYLDFYSLVRNQLFR